MYKHKADEFSKKLGISELAKSVGVLNKDGVKITSDKNKNVRPKSIGATGGNSAQYRIARLKRDYPEVATRLEQGEFKNVAEAERATV